MIAGRGSPIRPATRQLQHPVDCGVALCRHGRHRDRLQEPLLPATLRENIEALASAPPLLAADEHDAALVGRERVERVAERARREVRIQAFRTQDQLEARRGLRRPLPRLAP
eukprot:2603987-Prymnesium_polylepis.1